MHHRVLEGLEYDPVSPYARPALPEVDFLVGLPGQIPYHLAEALEKIFGGSHAGDPEVPLELCGGTLRFPGAALLHQTRSLRPRGHGTHRLFDVFQMPDHRRVLRP